MPYGSIQILPGVDVNKTPTLNEAGISQTNLVRFIYDRTLGALIQKLGGWTKYYPTSFPAIVRALWAWEDTNNNSYLAVGLQNIGTTGTAQLSVIKNGSQSIITPRSSMDNVTPAASTTAGNATVQITDATTTGITSYDAVYILTHMSVGGLIMFGMYATTQVGTTVYEIQSTDLLGNSLPAMSTSTTTTVASFTTAISTNVVTVVLTNHGYTVGSTYPILVSTTVGGVVLYGNYIVQSVIDANTFTIECNSIATATATAPINGGNAAFIYSYGVGAIPLGSGYGVGGYGLGGYGTGATVTASQGTAISAVDWTLDNFGEILISCPINETLFQPIYQWDPTSGSPTATVISQAPTINDGVFVAMPQRQLIAWGSTETGIQDPLLIRWCDIENLNVWVAQYTNQAGSYRITRGSRIVSCIQGPQQGLIWTDVDIWSMQYIGQPYIYSFNEIGTGCGLIGRKAAASVNGLIYWMGPSQFFTLNSDGVQIVPCPIWDVIFQDLDMTNTQKIRVAVNSRFAEITWYYPTLSSGGEVNAYAKFNIGLNTWDYGALGRTAWVDQSVLGPPIGADPNTLYVYQHETSNDADGQPMLSSFQTGYFVLSEADVKAFIDQVWPDMKWGQYGQTQNATVNLTFFVADYPGQTPQQFGPYPLTQATQFISPRFRGRLTSVLMSSNDIGSFWRIGKMRYRFCEDGKF